MTVHVVVTCSKRKKSTGEIAYLRKIREATVEDRATAWFEALATRRGPTLPARDLYQGEQWSLLRDLEEHPPDSREIKCWILSAGYGLVPFEAQLSPYSATFSPDHPDSVFDPGFELPFDLVLRRWWEAIAQWEGPAGAPRSLAALVENDAESAILVAASPMYLRAIEKELVEATERMHSPTRLLVFSGGSGNGRTHESLLAFDGRLQNHVGGSLMALNARVLTTVLAQAVSLDRKDVQRTLDRWTKAAPERTKHDRRPMEDPEVREFIQDELERDPQARWTPLLRKLRDDLGGACEQKRFRGLFQEIAGEADSAG